MQQGLLFRELRRGVIRELRAWGNGEFILFFTLVLF